MTLARAGRKGVVTPSACRTIFARQRAAFARLDPEMGRVGLSIVRARCPVGESTCAARDLAWMEGGHVYILHRALARGAAVVAGLLAHELGHAMDPWKWGPGSEQRADDLAEIALGRRVRYTRGDAVQTFGRGTYPRPAHLHQ